MQVSWHCPRASRRQSQRHKCEGLGVAKLKSGVSFCLAHRSSGIAPVQGAGSPDDTPLPVRPKGNDAGPLGMKYYGGPVLHNPIPVYIFWLGAFSTRQKTLVRKFFASLNPSKDRNQTGMQADDSNSPPRAMPQ